MRQRVPTVNLVAQFVKPQLPGPLFTERTQAGWSLLKPPECCTKEAVTRWHPRTGLICRLPLSFPRMYRLLKPCNVAKQR